MSKIAKSEQSLFFEKLFDNDINIKDRIIYLNDDIGELVLDHIQKALDYFENKSTTEPITIEISSYGGCV